MKPIRTKRIVLLVILFGGLACAALWTSVYSAWAQQHLFGPPPVLDPHAESKADAIAWYQYEASDLDRRLQSIGQPSFEAHCNDVNDYSVLYYREGIFEKTNGAVVLRGNVIKSFAYPPSRAGTAAARLQLSDSQALSQTQLREIWDAIEQAKFFELPTDIGMSDAIDGYNVMIQVCQGGRSWIVGGNSPEGRDPNAPILKVTRILHKYLKPIAETH